MLILFLRGEGTCPFFTVAGFGHGSDNFFKTLTRPLVMGGFMSATLRLSSVSAPSARRTRAARAHAAASTRSCPPREFQAVSGTVVPAVLSCAIITRLRKNGFGAQRLCLPKQCVALNVPNSPKFTRAMISQHMYYINNPLFYISQRLVIHIHKRCNTTDEM